MPFSTEEGENGEDNTDFGDDAAIDFVLPDGVIEMELNDELKASFLSYTMSIILA